MLDWIVEIRKLQALDAAIPDERITAVAGIAAEQARAILGAESYDQLLGAQDIRLVYAIAAQSISMLLKSSRSISEGSSIHDVTGWGQGEIRSSEISEIIRLSRDWAEAAKTTLNQLRSEIPAEMSWVDI